MEDSLTEMLLARLERISADSALAHKASGLRGALLNSLEEGETGWPIHDGAREHILRRAYEILEREASRYSQRFGGVSGRP